MLIKPSYEIFIICPNCDYRKHYFSDQRPFLSKCPKCEWKFGGGDLPINGMEFGAKRDIERVQWLRTNYEKTDRLNMKTDAGVTLIVHNNP
jgi:hypothetical protein